MPTRPAELFVGLPLAGIVGAAVGALGTFKHQVGISATTGTGFPLGLLLALAMVAVVLAAFRVAFDGRGYALAAALGVVAAVFVLSNRGPGGSAVVLANYAGTAWTVAPAILAAVVIGFPRLRRRATPPRTAATAATEAADGRMEHPTEGSDPA